MSKPIRVLHVLGGLSLGGAESRIMDLYRNIDRDKVQFDFLVHQQEIYQQDGRVVRIPEFYDDEINKLGGNIYVLPRFKLYNYFAYKKAVNLFFKANNQFAVIQGHMTSTASIYLPAARKAGIPTAVAHARSAGVDKGIKGIITKLLRLPLMGRSDYCFACSEEAGRSVFGKEWIDSSKAFVIPNAIEAERYRYKKEMRTKIREDLNISDCLVIGHVGRFHYAKNHEFLLDIFALIKDRWQRNNRKAVLMLLGEGSNMEEMKGRAGELGIEENVLFLGNRQDVWSYYQAMDFFVFPSRFEGLPGTVVEAQAAGLRCIISNRITAEAGFSELVYFEGIDRPPAEWAEYIINHIDYERENMCGIVRNAGFDVKEQALRMERFYVTGEINGSSRRRY